MNSKIIMVLVAIIIATGAFFAGIQYQKSQSNQVLAGIGAGGYARRFGAAGRLRANGSTVTRGEIISADANSITVKLRNGNSKIVLFSDKTSVNKTVSGSTTDLTTGQQVMVFGTNNTDGSVTAQIIQLNPLLNRQATPSGAAK